MVENLVNIVIEKSLPFARLIEKPIYTLDKSLCQGLDFVEVKMPIIKEEPKEILNKTKSIVSNRLWPAVKTFSNLKQETKQKVRIMTLLTYYKVHYLRSYSWQQADRVMSTETGISILRTVDSTTDRVELILDKYLPASQEEIEEDTEEVCSERDKLHHTMERLIYPDTTQTNNSNKMPVLCNICDKIFVRQSSHNRHIREVHQAIPKPVSYSKDAVWLCLGWMSASFFRRQKSNPDTTHKEASCLMRLWLQKLHKSFNKFNNRAVK
ncbi:hypothetical protein KPH14_004205 [Odynerus spinipes]|uniref:C2H2-type domain-containing protein n=1 Tax=Odynerus spinipes TaxID=1348599 RepID=A0AAD9VW48_9HYME|nr:hypothetical protein KPH14_004205 [Odynerus spinipes]